MERDGVKSWARLQAREGGCLMLPFFLLVNKCDALGAVERSGKLSGGTVKMLELNKYGSNRDNYECDNRT